VTRTAVYTALALRVRRSGENREASFLCAEEGIVRATVFGGPKSSLRSAVAPFNAGRLLVYHDPVKDTRKVSEFDVSSWRPGLREVYERSESASKICAAVLYSHGGGGSWPEALALAAGALDALERAGAGACRSLYLRFLWRWAGFLGQRPDLTRCSACACEIPPDGVVWYRAGELYCPACAAGSGLLVGAESRRWLLSAEGSRPFTDRDALPDPAVLSEAETLARAVVHVAW
jgi:DNA repair protein RecO (recombination protein O)